MPKVKIEPHLSVNGLPLTREYLAACALHLRAICAGESFARSDAPEPPANADELPESELADRGIHAMIVVHRDCMRILVTSLVSPKRKTIAAIQGGYLAWLDRDAEHCLRGTALGQCPWEHGQSDVFDLEDHCAMVSPCDGAGFRIEITYGTRDYLNEWLDEVAGRNEAPVLDALNALLEAPSYQRGHFKLEAQDVMRQLLEE